MKNPNPLMLLRIAQADAYCVATEYIRFPRDWQTHEDAKKFERYIKHPTHSLAAGMYTDDTQMSIAVAEQLIKNVEATPEDYADSFMEAFLRDPRDGYSRGFQKVLSECKTGQELVSKLVPTSTKNGAAMRSVPLGVLSFPLEVVSQAWNQASVTHHTHDGIYSSMIVGLLSHFALYTDASFIEILGRVRSYAPPFRDIFDTSWKGPVVDMTSRGGRDVGINTVHAVCTLLRDQTTLMGILNQIIEWGGDTDSVAAIAWGIASTRMHEPVPEFLEHCLEPGGKYGPIFLRELGEKLMEKFGDK